MTTIKAKSAAVKTASENAAEWHKGLVTAKRYRGGSSVANRSIDEEAASDRARILYSSAFRRLQHKTQVFTLSRDAAVRSRLTHSLEVASVGRWIAQRVVDIHLQKVGLPAEYGAAIVSLVETACLAHDIGNPAFGHFGEATVREWFSEKWQQLAGALHTDMELGELMNDFLQFDGNPQGMRILTRLQGRTRQERESFGMDLTYSQILTALKYPRGPKDADYRWKKPGFFESERSKIESAWNALGFKCQQRFALAYLVEAADDISYSIGDMEDGIDQQIFSPRVFFAGIQKWVRMKNPPPELRKLREEALKCTNQVNKRGSTEAEAKDQFIIFKTAFTNAMIREATRAYGDGMASDIRDGSRQELLQCSDAQELLQTLKGIARHYLYPASKVQRPFLAGLKVTRGILDAYGKFLTLPRKQFNMLLDAWRAEDRQYVVKNKLETLLPLLDQLPSHYLDVYRAAVLDRKDEEAWEWYCRAHLIVDYLSGMTDDFAHRTYQVISGVQLD